MNLNNKFKLLGFKRSPTALKIENSIIVPDVDEYGRSPKWIWCYTYKFNNEIKLLCTIYRQSEVKIWIENKSGKKAKADLVYHSSMWNEKRLINSKNDIINLFPKEMQREMKINQLI